MIHFLNKIWNNQSDESVHSQFVRFSKGEFHNRAVFKIRKGEKIKINSTFELANDLVRFAASLTKKMHCTGLVLSRESLSLPGEEKNSKGLYKYDIDMDLDSGDLITACDKSYATLLDCEGEGISLKTKKKLPKPNPKGAEGKVNDKFCVMELDGKFWPKVKEEFLFGLSEGKRYELSHVFNITDIILPSGEKDPEKMRLNAKRKGKIRRKSIVDGKEVIIEKDFVA